MSSGRDLRLGDLLAGGAIHPWKLGFDPVLETAVTRVDELLLLYTSRKELAAKLGVGERTLVRWGLIGIGPRPTKIGRRTYYAAEDVRVWLQSRAQTRRGRR